MDPVSRLQELQVLRNQPTFKEFLNKVTSEASHLQAQVLEAPIEDNKIYQREQSIGEYRGLLRLGKLLDTEIAELTERIKSENLK